METWNETDEWADRYVRGDLSGEDRVALIKWLEASPEHLRQFRKILQTEMRVSAAGKWRRWSGRPSPAGGDGWKAWCSHRSRASRPGRHHRRHRFDRL